MTSKDLKKSVKITLTTLLIYGLLVASHLGEFWPFSIYPMFSQAGNPWKRAIIQDVSNVPAEQLWVTRNKSELPGQTIPLSNINVNTNDVANYLSKTKTWTPNKVDGVRSLVNKEVINKKLMVYQARGALDETDSTTVTFVPYIYLTADTTQLNKNLKTK